jgi:hypothetical protein
MKVMASGDHVKAVTISGEDDPSREVTGPLTIQHVDDYDYDHYIVDGRSVKPESVKKMDHKKTSIISDGMECLYCGKKDPDTKEICPNTKGSKHTLESRKDKEYWGQGYGPGPGQSGVKYSPDSRGWDGNTKKIISTYHESHGFSQDDVCRHCFACGSGDVIGRSDGSISCEFCGKIFTIQVQPEFSEMPQNVGGQQMGIDGSPDDDGGASSIPESGPGMQDPGASGGFPDGIGPEAGSPQDEETNTNGSSFQASRNFYVTASEDILDEDAYIRHIAIKTARDKNLVLRRIRESR